MAIIQIAGVLDAAEARMIADAGVHWIGFPLKLAVHPDDVPADVARTIIHEVRAHARPVLITYLDRADEVRSLCAFLGVRAVQLHGHIAAGEFARLRALDDGLYVMKSLVVKTDNAATLEAMVDELSPHVDAFITDTYDPTTGAMGATGKTHDWSVSRRLVEISRRPVILAGGLRPENVREAILTVCPFGVDVHTGVEGPDGRKDPRLVRRFVAAASGAFADLQRGGAAAE